MPVDARPDRAGVVFSLEGEGPGGRSIFHERFIVGRAINGPKDFNSYYARTCIKMFVEQGGLPVFLSNAGVMSMIYPDFAFADAIARPILTPFQSLVPQAYLWRQNYGLD